MFDAEKLLGGLLLGGARRKSGLNALVPGGAGMALLGVAIEAFEHFTKKPGDPASYPPPPPAPGSSMTCEGKAHPFPPPPPPGPPPALATAAGSHPAHSSHDRRRRGRRYDLPRGAPSHSGPDGAAEPVAGGTVLSGKGVFGSGGRRCPCRAGPNFRNCPAGLCGLGSDH